MNDLIKNSLKNSLETNRKLLQDDQIHDNIILIVRLCLDAFESGNKLLLCGNGGSASDAQHIASELSGRFYKDRSPLNAQALHVNSCNLIKTSIETKIVATGKVIPEDEVEIKPQIAGIVDKILVQEGDKVKAGDLLVKIKVVPDEQALNNAEGRVENAKIVLAETLAIALKKAYETNPELNAERI